MAPRDRHASRASFACVRCKKDKRRCDVSQMLNEGGQPDRPCTACRNKNEKCEVRHGEDKRSNRQPNHSKALHRRMQALEEFVKNASRADSQASGRSQDDESMDCLIGAAHKPADDVESSGKCAFPSPTSSSPNPSSFATPISMPPQEGQAWWPATPQGQQRAAASLRSESFSSQYLPEFDRSPCFPPAMDEVSVEGGVEDHDLYFGSGSMFPYSKNKDKSDNDILVAEVHPEELWDRRYRAALETIPEPEPIVVYLLEVFWQWQSSHLLVVDKNRFLRHRKIWEDCGSHGDRNVYTPCLLYAILALASMISLDRGVKRYSASLGSVAGENFSRRARALLDLEMERPTITTVQAALLLGCKYGAMVDNPLGWTYSGIAFRIATNLGLHLDCSKAVASGRISSEIAELRRRVFWACHVEDNLFSAYCGRPTFFNEREISILIPDEPADESNIHSCLLHATSTLSIMCSRILAGFYGQRRCRTAHELRLKASHLHNDLWQWHQGLPMTLKLQNRRSPVPARILILHMTFYFALLLLHRPFLHLSRVSCDLKGSDLSFSNPTATCAKAAASITKLAIHYRRIFDIRQVPPQAVHFIFLAGSIHLINLRLTMMKCHHAHVRSCLEALSEIGKSYPTAQKAAMKLQNLVDRWRLCNQGEFDHESCNHKEAGESRDDGGYDFSHFPAPESSLFKELHGDTDDDYHGEKNLEFAEPSSSIDPHHIVDSGPNEPWTMEVGNDSAFLESGIDWLSDTALIDTIGGNA